MLTHDQIRHYHDQGFLILENAIAADHLASVQSAAQGIVSTFDVHQHHSVFSTRDRDAGRDDYFFESAEKIHCFLEEDAVDHRGKLTKPVHLAVNKIGHAMHDLDPAFKSFCQLPLFASVLRDIGYTHPLLWQTMYIFKQPHIGGEVRWHQDASYLISSPATVTGIWVAIEDANRDNGCLWVQPGGHHSPLREIYQVDWKQRKGRLTQIDSTPWPGMDAALAVEVPAGSLVLFHDHMPHYSSQNRSAKSRHALTLHVAEHNADWPAENWLQRRQLRPFRL